MCKHAFLSASSAYRWIECPPSAWLCSGKSESSGNPSAQQGTDSHALSAYLVSKGIGREVHDPTENLTYYDQEMQECAEGYAAYVLERVKETRQECPGAQVLMEEKVDFSRWVPGGFGTADCLIVSDGMVEVIDFKYGIGVLVSPEMNPQMMCYALGALTRFDPDDTIREIRMTIYQPRRENVRTCAMTKGELLTWAQDVLAPAAKLAYVGKGEFRAGEHCRFCKVRNRCRKRAEIFMEMEENAGREAATLGVEEIAAILPKIDGLVMWANDVKAFALQSAKSGMRIPGYKVVQGSGRRRFTDEEAVAEKVQAEGFDPYEKKLRSMTALTAILGRKRFEQLLGPLTMRPPGNDILVPDTDKRTAVGTAADDFKDDWR